jgi:hypothetical protein
MHDPAPVQVNSEIESDEKPLVFKRTKSSAASKEVNLGQNMKQNTEFYVDLKEVKMFAKNKRKGKKSTKPKLSAAPTKGKSS